MGLQYRLDDRWTLKAGFLYASSGVDDEYRDFSLRLGRVLAGGVGAEYALTENHIFGLNFNYVNMGDAPVDTEDVPLVGRISGEFDHNHTFLFDLSYRFRF